MALCSLLLAATVPAAAAAVSAPQPQPHARSAIIIDSVSGRVLYGKSIHRERQPASLTKIMTAFIVIERSPDLSRRLVAPPSVAASSGIGLRPGERITIRQALLGLMIKSAQDCAATLAIRTAGDTGTFVRWMNAKARRLGLRDTHFTNVAGNRDTPHHHSSAYDLARLGRYAMRDARFREIVRHDTVTVRWGSGRSAVVDSHNLLLTFPWGDGIKCGLTKSAGYCLAGSGKPGLRAFVSVTLGGYARREDNLDHVALFEWATTLYEEKTVVAAGDQVAAVPLVGGGDVPVAAATTLTAVVRSAAPVRVSLTLPDGLAERPAEGTVAGTAEYRADGVRLGAVRLVAMPEPPPAASLPFGSPDPRTTP